MTQGVLYILYDLGSKISYTNELKTSIRSLRKHCDLPITVYTDGSSLSGVDNIKIVKINELKELAPDHKREDPLDRGYAFLKLYALKDLPYDFTIFADTDTYFLNDPSKLISEDNDLAICRDFKYKRDNTNPLTKRFNTGFFIAKKGKNFELLIDKAIEIREEKSVMCDQVAINQAMDYTCNIDIKILPQSWNIRGRYWLNFCQITNPNMLHWHGASERVPKKYGEVVELVDTMDLKSIGH